MGKKRGTSWERGAAILTLVIVGYFFFQNGPARLTALAARLPVISFISGQQQSVSEKEEGLLERAAGLHLISGFMEEEEVKLAQAEPDPAYGNFKRAQESIGTAGAEEGETVTKETGENLTEESQGTGAAESSQNGQESLAEGTGETTETAAGNGENGAGEAQAGELPANEGQPAMAATEIKGTVYTAEQLSDFEFLKSKFFYVHKSTTAYPEQLDANILLSKDMTIPESSEPQILLFHTHGSEAFSDSAAGDANMTVVGVGNYLAQLLSEQYGIQVIHNTEVFPYSDSYSMALDMLNQTLAEHPSIQVTIDLHRDSGGHDVVDINGKPTAPIMFFNGMCQTPEGPLDGVENPYLMDNLAFNFQMKLKAEAYYPGFTLRTFLKAYRYNQHVLPRATLVEVGTENNTFEEAKNAMEPLADILYKVLRGK